LAPTSITVVTSSLTKISASRPWSESAGFTLSEHPVVLWRHGRRDR
jgi:hypothetical protein